MGDGDRFCHPSLSPISHPHPPVHGHVLAGVATSGRRSGPVRGADRHVRRESMPRERSGLGIGGVVGALVALALAVGVVVAPTAAAAQETPDEIDFLIYA